MSVVMGTQLLLSAVIMLHSGGDQGEVDCVLSVCVLSCQVRERERERERERG